MVVIIPSGLNREVVLLDKFYCTYNIHVEREGGGGRERERETYQWIIHEFLNFSL